MKNCPRCQVVNPDTAEHCDCGFSFVLQSGGTTPVPMRARTMPAAVTLHAVIVAATLAMYAWRLVSGRAPLRSTRPEEEFAALVVATVVLVALFMMMVSGKAWARLTLGILTLPAGLLILWPASAREFTDEYYSGQVPKGRRTLQ
jgi:hypothetical protein